MDAMARVGNGRRLAVPASWSRHLRQTKLALPANLRPNIECDRNGRIPDRLAFVILTSNE